MFFFLLKVTCKNCLKIICTVLYRILFPFCDNIIRQQKKPRFFLWGGSIIQKQIFSIVVILLDIHDKYNVDNEIFKKKKMIWSLATY